MKHTYRTIFLITGFTSGIGKATALALSEIPDAHLILIGRNAERGRRVLKRLEQRCGTDMRMCDLSSVKQVRELSDNLIESYAVIDVVVNNAGARFDQFKESEDGIELTFATNHLGHFLLASQLIDGLANRPKRIINVSSSAHREAHSELGWILTRENYNRSLAYANSKLANLLFTQELSRRFDSVSLSSYAVDPGPTATRFARNNGLVAWMKHLVWHGWKKELRSAAQGADTVVYLATEALEENLNGKLFADRTPVDPAPQAEERELSAQLWDLSCSLASRGRFEMTKL